MRLVAKFGGSSVADGEKIRNAATSIKKEVERGHEVLVVVSAMGKSTNSLIEALETSTNGNYTGQHKDDITAMGERTSVRVLSACLNSMGVESTYLEPCMKEWPVMTTDKHVEARIKLEDTKKLAQKHVLPMLKKQVVVMCGFLGIGSHGRITTIGRGGSDTTATVMGNCLDADKVIIVTDVDGVYSADPRLVEEPQLVREITSDVFWDLAVSGAGVLKWDALEFKGDNQILKIVNNRHRDLSADGTEVKGGFMKTNVEKMKEPLASVTIAGDSIIDYPGLLATTSKLIGDMDVNIWGVTVAPNSMSFFVEEKKVDEVISALHDLTVEDKKLVSVTSTKGVGLAWVSSPKFLDEPGILGKITGAIGEAGFNIKEVTTSKSQIMVFVDYKNLDAVYEIIQLLFK